MGAGSDCVSATDKGTKPYGAITLSEQPNCCASLAGGFGVEVVLTVGTEPTDRASSASWTSMLSVMEETSSNSTQDGVSESSRIGLRAAASLMSAPTDRATGLDGSERRSICGSRGLGCRSMSKELFNQSATDLPLRTLHCWGRGALCSRFKVM